MRIITTLFLIAISSITLSAQQDSLNLRFIFDQEEYNLGDTIRVTVESDQSFMLLTDGGCQAKIIYPYLIIARDGKFTETTVRRQLCCGIPYSDPLNQIQVDLVPQIAGKYKIAVPIYYQSPLLSPEIIVKE